MTLLFVSTSISDTPDKPQSIRQFPSQDANHHGCLDHRPHHPNYNAFAVANPLSVLKRQTPTGPTEPPEVCKYEGGIIGPDPNNPGQDLYNPSTPCNCGNYACEVIHCSDHDTWVCLMQSSSINVDFSKLRRKTSEKVFLANCILQLLTVLRPSGWSYDR